MESLNKCTLLFFLGDLSKIKIEHDNSSFLKSSWFCESVQVVNLGTNQKWNFPCQKWLDKKKSDIFAELYPRD